MEMKSITCPKCGGSLEIVDGLDVFFCKYCGNKIMLDGMSDAAYKAKTESKRMDYEAKAQERQYEHEFRTMEHNDKFFFKVVKGCILLFVGCLLMTLCVGVIPEMIASHSDKNRVRELKNISYDIEECLSDGDYTEAEALTRELNTIIGELEDSSNRETWQTQYNEYRSILNRNRTSLGHGESIMIRMTLTGDQIAQMGEDEAVNYLYEVGYSNVRKVEVNTSHPLQSMTVQSISIDGDTEFESGDEFDYNSEVIVFVYRYMPDYPNWLDGDDD